MDDGTFQKFVKRVRGSATRDDLAAAIQASLKSLLQQSGDKELLQSLLAQAGTLTRNLPSNTGEQTPEVRQAAVRCVLLLETARKGRQPDKPNRRLLILGGTAAAVAVLYFFLLR